MALLKLNLSRDRLVLGASVVLALFVVGATAFAFWQQIALSRQMRLETGRLVQILEGEQKRHEALLAQLAYVRSEEYLERWAREEARMVKPGEVLVMLMRDEVGEPNPQVLPAATVESGPKPVWVRFLELFHGPADWP